MIIVFWLKPMDLARIRWRQMVEGALGGWCGVRRGGVDVFLLYDE